MAERTASDAERIAQLTTIAERGFYIDPDDVLWLLSDRAALAKRVEELEIATRCPWCDGSGAVEAGGWPDVNGHPRMQACPCGDGTAAGAFTHMAANNRDLREKSIDQQARIEALTRDAARYQYLRSLDSRGETLDKVIDAARAALSAPAEERST